MPVRRVFFAVALGVSLQAAPPDYARDVAPLLEAKCGSCHSEKSKASGFVISSLDAVRAGGKKHGKAILGGHPERSPLVAMLKGELAPKMPMGGELSTEEIATIEGWIRTLPAEKATAKSEWRWPYEKPVKPNVPQGVHAVDYFIESRLAKEGLQLAKPASRATLARRVYFDLIGMPPSPEELRSFVNDAAPDAYEKLIDQLLADSRYGERWGRHWLDLVRYGETSGLEGDGAIGNAWRYRDWVIDAFNKDMPYDRFVLKQLGGADEHSKTRNNYQVDVQGYIPLGYLRLAPWDRSNLVADEVRANYLAEITATTGSAFLGLSIGCARCHDHKYDPIPQRDYYRFQAFFNTIQVEDVEVPYKDEAFKEKAEAKIKALETELENGPDRKALDAMEAALFPKYIAARKADAKDKPIGTEALRLEMRRKDSKIFTKEEREHHADLLEDADRTLDPEEKAALQAYEDKLLVRLKEKGAPPERFDALTKKEFQAEIKRHTSKFFAKEEIERYQEVSERLETLRRRLNRWKPVTLSVKNVPGPPNGPAVAPIRVLNRGDYRLPGAAVEAGFPTAILGKEAPAVIEQDRYRQFPTRGSRITLARWIASPENPLTARVMVNRIWQHHFGSGIVATPSDFGANGERPTHPELLDWMAHYFVENGWSVKSMHRLILTSKAYRQSAENGTNNKDPENKLLWRFPRRRLEAEEIRDSVLYLSGRLNSEQGGPSVFPPLPADLADFARYGRGGALMWETNETESEARRRSVYTFQRRSMPLPMMAAFDAPVFSESCERRSSTTTPLQALSLMNGQLMQEESQIIAKRAGSIDGAFQLILQRAPTSEEKDRFATFSGPLDAMCRVLLSSNEFLYVE